MQSLTDSPRYIGLRISPDAYFELKDDGFKYDMIDGVLHLAPSGSSDHSRRQTRFLFLLGLFLEDHPVGEAFAELDVKLPDGGDVLRPDVSFVLHENASIVQQWIFGVPDLICEILSPSTRARDLSAKADRYLRNGVAELWFIDPVEFSVEARFNCGDAWECVNGDVLESRVLPGLRIIREALFRSAGGEKR